MNKTQRHHNGQFITTGDPTPLMSRVMDSILKQQQAEHEYRMAVRAGKIQPEQFTNWNISDRH
jgi:hypothetical protein